MVQLVGVEGRRQRPYVLTEYSTTSRIVLDQNPSYWGRKPAFERVVVRNMVAATQFINIQRGQHEVAIDLSAQQADSLKSNNGSRCRRSRRPGCSGSSRTTTRRSPPRPRTSASRTASAALDYPSFVQLAGGGAIQARGSSRRCSSASLPPRGAVKRDLNKAKSEIAASGVGTRRSRSSSRATSRSTAPSRPRSARAGQPRGGGAPGRARGRAGRNLAGQVPERQDGLRPLLWGPDYPDRPTTSPSCRASSSGSAWAGRRGPTSWRLAARRGSRRATSQGPRSTARSRTG